MSNQKNNAVVVDSCTQRLKAFGQYVNDKTPMTMDGKKLKASQVVAIYQSCLDSRAALTTKRAETKAAMAVRTSAEQARVQADRAVKAWVTNEFGVGSQQAIDFGFAAPKAAKRTALSKVNAVLQAQATRKARGTMGKKQKSLIKGVVVSPTAPAVPVNTPAGASPASQTATLATPVAAPQPVTPATPVAAPQVQPQVVNGASAPAAPVVANGASGH